MAKAHNGPAILTANEIRSGRIVFWTGTHWSATREHAMRVDPSEAGSLQTIARTEEAADRVVGPEIVTLDAATGSPVALRQRYRLAGPSVALPTPNIV